MKYYELTCLISGNLSEIEIKNLAEKIMTYLSKGGENLKTTPSLISLNFYSLPEDIETIEKKLKAESQIQRYMILNKTTPRTEVKVSRKLTKKPLTKTEKKPEEKKVELEEIEKKLDEILKES